MSDKDVKIPEDLHEIVEKSIQQGLIQRKQRSRRNKTIGLSAAAGCCAFLFFFNTNTVFAKTVMDLPLVSQIAHLFLDSESTSEEAAYIAEIKVPQLENNDQAQSLNAAIREQIEAHAIAMKQQAADEYQALWKPAEKPRNIFRPEFLLIISSTATTIKPYRSRLFPLMCARSPARRSIVITWKPEPDGR